MRKMILSMMVSLDGFIEDTAKGLEWHVWNDEMDKYMIGFFETVDTLIFGRKTYQMMADFWPGPAALAENTTIAKKMNSLPKIVFSKTLSSASWGQWNNATVMGENITEEIAKLKEQPGKDMVIFGGADLASEFMQRDLIDEYRIIVNPIVLGGGKSLFRNIDKKFKLKHIRTQTFDCGDVMLCYQR